MTGTGRCLFIYQNPNDSSENFSLAQTLSLSLRLSPFSLFGRVTRNEFVTQKVLLSFLLPHLHYYYYYHYCRCYYDYCDTTTTTTTTCILMVDSAFRQKAIMNFKVYDIVVLLLSKGYRWGGKRVYYIIVGPFVRAATSDALLSSTCRQ